MTTTEVSKVRNFLLGSNRNFSLGRDQRLGEGLFGLKT